jgi:hypothetical protein
VADERRLQ